MCVLNQEKEGTNVDFFYSRTNKKLIVNAFRKADNLLILGYQICLSN